MAFLSRVSSQLRIAAAIVLLPLILLPGVVTASSLHRPLASTSLKSLALRLSDIQHVYGTGLTAASVGSNRKSADIACANAPTIEFANGFGTSNGGPVHKNGLLNITAELTQYTTSGGPLCQLKYDISVRKTLGSTDGVVSTLRGVGNQAELIRLDPTKNVSGPPVYGLDVKFIRGHYLVLVAVQMNRKVRPADVTKLAQAVDGRVKHSG
jgi:hypothetical protein